MLSFSESFRCGYFFAGKEFGDKPFQKLFILPKRFPINQSYFEDDESIPKRYSKDSSCPINNPLGTEENPSVHKDYCYNLVSNTTYDI